MQRTVEKLCPLKINEILVIFSDERGHIIGTKCWPLADLIPA